MFQGRSAEAEEVFSQRSSDRPPKADNRSRIISSEVEQLLFVCFTGKKNHSICQIYLLKH